jgi:2-(1,2-epoxy-1,2-dihydrophenyl)acetyl-CoA isomerase
VTELHVDDADGVRTIALDRPESKNGLTVAIVRAYAQAILQRPADTCVLVLGGRNGAFCSGLDLKDAKARGLSPGPELERGLREDFHGLIRVVHGATCPTVAAVDGIAAGFGCDLALACDIRIISERASFGELFVRRGLMPDGGGTWLLPRLVGLGRAIDLMLTGDVIDAHEAIRIGLATRIVPVAEHATRVAELAAGLAKGAPLAYRAIKQAVYAGADGSLDAALDREATGQLALLASEDFEEGITAFLQKREPKFRGR